MKKRYALQIKQNFSNKVLLTKILDKKEKTRLKVKLLEKWIKGRKKSACYVM
jgi:hypothetical protein